MSRASAYPQRIAEGIETGLPAQTVEPIRIHAVLALRHQRYIVEESCVACRFLQQS
jgi:hypothetical protein